MYLCLNKLASMKKNFSNSFIYNVYKASRMPETPFSFFPLLVMQ